MSGPPRITSAFFFFECVPSVCVSITLDRCWCVGQEYVTIPLSTVINSIAQHPESSAGRLRTSHLCKACLFPCMHTLRAEHCYDTSASLLFVVRSPEDTTLVCSFVVRIPEYTTLYYSSSSICSLPSLQFILYTRHSRTGC
jgi:hypothetical protein